MSELHLRTMIENVRPEFWREFLGGFQGYCDARGVRLDFGAARGDRAGFAEQLFELLATVDDNNDGDGMKLGGALEALVHVAEDDGHDHVRAALEQIVPDAGVPRRLTTAELAFYAYLRHPNAFELAKQWKQRAARQRLWEFLPADRRRFDGTITDQVREALRAALREHHERLGHTAYAGVRVVEAEHETRIFWSHGRAAQTQSVICEDDDGLDNRRELRRELQTVVRERCDAAIVDRASGRLAVCAGDPRQVEFLRATMGAVFFGDPAHYAGTNIYTGAPLLHRGRRALGVDGIAALSRILLLEICVEARGVETIASPSRTVCLFDAKPERMEAFQEHRGAVVLGMKLRADYRDGRTKTVEIKMPNRIVIDRRRGEMAVREFLVTRELATYGNHDPHDWTLAA